MKAILFAIVLASLSACSKPNNVPVLEDQAHALVKCGDAKVAAFDRRTAAINRELGNRPLPPDGQRALHEATDSVSGLRQIDAQVGSTAANLAKDGHSDELQKLVHETGEKQEQLDTVAKDDLTAIEAWLSRASTPAAAEPPPAPPPPPADDMPVNAAPAAAPAAPAPHR